MYYTGLQPDLHDAQRMDEDENGEHPDAATVCGACQLAIDQSGLTNRRLPLRLRLFQRLPAHTKLPAESPPCGAFRNDRVAPG